MAWCVPVGGDAGIYWARPSLAKQIGKISGGGVQIVMLEGKSG